MSSTYTVKNNDSVGSMLLDAKKSDKELTYRTFAKVTKNIKVGDTITIPKSKKHAGSTSAEPKEGKCGNECTCIAIGKKATATSVSVKINNKSTPTLETDQTYILEKDQIKESQQGSIDIVIGGKEIPFMKDLSKLKHKVGTHKDVKVKVVLVDEEVMTTIPHIDKFRSPDQQATMTPVELAISQTIHYNQMQSLESFGIKVNASKRHTMMVIEIPPGVKLDTGELDMNTIKEEALQIFTEAIAIATASENKGSVSGLTAFGAEVWGILGSKEKRAFWKQMGLGGKYVVTSERGAKLVQFFPSTHFSAMMKAQPSKNAAKKIKQGLVKYNKKYKLRYADFGKQFKQAIPFIGKTKLGHLEKFVAGVSKGGTVYSVIFLGSIATAKWAMDEKSQAVDLWAIGGIVIGQVILASLVYDGVSAAAAFVAIEVLGMAAASIVLTVGAGIVAAVFVAWVVADKLEEYKVQENLQNFLRDIEFTGKTGLSRDEPVPIYNHMW